MPHLRQAPPGDAMTPHPYRTDAIDDHGWSGSRQGREADSPPVQACAAAGHRLTGAGLEPVVSPGGCRKLLLAERRGMESHYG
jgi:hypothetical protein